MTRGLSRPETLSATAFPAPDTWIVRGAAYNGACSRVGLAGWIIDRALGAEAELDEETARDEIAELCGRGLARLDAGRRLEATDEGARLWRQVKPA